MSMFGETDHPVATYFIKCKFDQLTSPILIEGLEKSQRVPCGAVESELGHNHGAIVQNCTFILALEDHGVR